MARKSKHQGASEKEQATGTFSVATNRRARHDYELGSSYEAGLVLMGSEVKSLRMQSADLTDAWVEVDGRGEAWIRGLRIPALKHAAFAHEEKRTRKLLLHVGEIEQLKRGSEREGFTLVATKLYFKNNRAKVEVALGRGKKLHDKRHSLKEKTELREAQAAMRRGR